MGLRMAMGWTLLLGAAGGSLSADVLTLRNGQELEGLIVDVDESRVLLRRDARPSSDPEPLSRREIVSVRLSTPDVTALRKQAERLESSRSIEESIEVWRIVCALRPENAPDQLRLAQSLRRSAHYEEAAAKAEAASRADPRDPRIPLEQGEIALSRGDPKQALEHARAHFRLTGPGSIDGNWLMGRACEEGYLVNDALSAYRMVLLADPKRTEVLERFTRFALAHGKDQAALEMAQSVIQSAPGLRAGWLALGKVQYRWGRYDQAVQSFQSATSLGGIDYERAVIFLRCARARLAHRDPRTAMREADVEIAEQLDPEIRRDKP